MGTVDDLRPLLGEPAGEGANAEDVFRDCERFLRRAVRRWLTPRLRQRFDSEDVVQSVWAGLLRAGDPGRRFPTPEQLRAYLARAARHRLIDQARRHNAAVTLERPTTPSQLAERASAGAPRPSEQVCADELWERMVALCPPEHRPVLDLRRQGLTLDEVAARTGLHEGSVRRILRTLARRVAFADTDAECARGQP